ncbi:MAG: TRAP transporter large permease subunit [Alphaproteobacteria bacterium]|jgi:tripartite ATP-independent transporter DctM subunit|nr:TRAP transporter large permease subunit [Alphaproteobacteria bacterium]
MELVDHIPALMVITLAVMLFTGYPVAFVLAGVGVLFAGLGVAIGEFPMVAFFNIPARLWGSINGSLIFPTVPMLIFMGVALEKSGVAQEMLLALQGLVRRLPGSMAVAMTVLGILLAPSAGLVGASVATLALIGLPTMLAQGYRRSYSIGSVAAAGTLGIILPPGIMLFFLSDLMQISMGPIFVSTLVPGLLLALLFMVYYIARALIDPATAPRLPADPSLRMRDILRNAARGLTLPVLLIASVLGSIIAGLATPVQSAAVGAAGGLLIMHYRGRLTRAYLHEVIVTTATTCSMVFFIILAASVFSYPFNFFEGGDQIRDFLLGLPLNDWQMLLTILGIIFILGFFVDWIEITVIVLPLLLPILFGLDFTDHVGGPRQLVPIWLAVQIALVLQSSFMTPPFGFSLFFAKGAAPPEVTLADTYRGVAPLVLVQLLVIGLVLAYPDLATWLPSLVME